MSGYLDMSPEQVRALPPKERHEAIVARDDARAARKAAIIADMPTKAELLQCDINIGALTDYTDTPVFTKNNYGTRYDPETGTYTRGDNKTRTVMEMRAADIDGTSSRQDNAMNRYLQGTGVQASQEAAKWRFIVMTSWNTIKAVCGRHNLTKLASLIEKRDWDNPDMAELRKASYKIKLTFDGKDYDGPMKDEKGKRIATNLGYMIESWSDALAKLGEANATLDVSIPLPRRKVD